MSEIQYDFYVSGGMTGYEEFNFPEFNKVSQMLRDKGFEVFNPTEVVSDTDNSWSYYMRTDIEMLTHCKNMAMLRDWEQSKGASLEVLIAKNLGMNFYDAYTLEPLNISCNYICIDIDRVREEFAKFYIV